MTCTAIAELRTPCGVGCSDLVSLRLFLNYLKEYNHVVFVGNSMVGGNDGLGGKSMRTVSCFRFFFGSSPSPTPVATVGPLGGGGGLLACGFGFGLCSSVMLTCEAG